LFEDDLDERQKIRASVIQAAALLGLGAAQEADELLNWIVAADPNHQFPVGLATDLAMDDEADHRHAI
jgi:hypothetical protein